MIIKHFLHSIANIQLMPALDMIASVWVKFVPDRGAFGIKATSFFGEETVVYAADIDWVFVFPARPRPGLAHMNISTDGVKMEVKQPFVISGEFKDKDGRRTLELRLHHKK